MKNLILFFLFAALQIVITSCGKQPQLKQADLLKGIWKVNQSTPVYLDVQEFSFNDFQLHLHRDFNADGVYEKEVTNDKNIPEIESFDYEIVLDGIFPQIYVDWKKGRGMQRWGELKITQNQINIITNSGDEFILFRK